MKHELDRLMEGADIVKFVKTKRLAWFGHVFRMEKSRLLEKMLNQIPVGARKRKRPKKRW